MDNLDLILLKFLISSKEAAFEFNVEGNQNLFDLNYRKIAELILNHTKFYKSLLTKNVLKDKLKSASLNEEYILELWDSIEKFPEQNNNDFRYYLEKIKTRYAEQELKRLNQTLNSPTSLKKSISELNSTLSKVNGVFNTKTYKRKSIKDTIPEYRERYKAKKENPEFGQGILTGYEFLDNLYNGWKKQEFFIVAGESGTGKSMLLMNLAKQMWLQKNSVYDISNKRQGYNVAYFSLEMPHDDCFDRLLASVAGVNQKRVRDCCLTPAELVKVKQATQFIESYDSHFDIIDIPRDATPDTIRVLLNEVKMEYKPDVVVVDYLGIMKASVTSADGDSDWLTLQTLSGDLFEIGRSEDVLMLSAVQLNYDDAAKKKNDPNMGMHRLARSKGIGSNVNGILMLQSRQNEDQYPDLNVHITKSRRTEKGSFPLYKKLEHCQLLNDMPETFNDEEVKDSSKEDISNFMEV